MAGRQPRATRSPPIPYNHSVTRPYPTRLFALIALTIVTVCAVVARTTSNPDIAAWGVTFDLTLTIPLVWYFVVVRSGAARAVTMIPLFVVCVALAAVGGRRGTPQCLRDANYAAWPLETVTPYLP